MSESTSLLVSKKKQETLFDRGFKAWCENTAITIRKRLGLDITSPLPPRELADVLGVTVWELDQVPDLKAETRSYLTSSEGDEWSAVTVVANGKQIILVNPTHSPARQSSDLMHEIAHVIKKHEAPQLFVSESGYTLRSFDEKQEAEADWFAATLLLPRTVLADCAYKRTPMDQILEEHAVSKQLYEYRMRMTGVNRQFRRS